MQAMQVKRAQIDAFLDRKRIAVLGVSRDARHFSRVVFRALRDHGCDVVPVNPRTEEVEGLRCYARLADISPAVEYAYLLLPKQAVGEALRECAAAGIRSVWVQGYLGPQELPAEHQEFCAQEGIALIAGYCPMLYLPETSWFHRIHGVVLRLMGRQPV